MFRRIALAWLVIFSVGMASSAEARRLVARRVDRGETL